MDVKKYTIFFHDGGIVDFQLREDNIEFSMESSELLPEWNPEHIPLSNTQTIRGKLHLFGVSQITINQVPVIQIKKIYDEGEILHFQINENNVTLLVIWSNFPPKNRVSICESIGIIAKEICWENIPHLKYD
jgi:hypothetical protein